MPPSADAPRSSLFYHFVMIGLLLLAALAYCGWCVWTLHDGHLGAVRSATELAERAGESLGTTVMFALVMLALFAWALYTVLTTVLVVVLPKKGWMALAVHVAAVGALFYVLRQ